jgi:hypothetical protein
MIPIALCLGSPAKRKTVVTESGAPPIARQTGYAQGKFTQTNNNRRYYRLFKYIEFGMAPS